MRNAPRTSNATTHGQARPRGETKGPAMRITGLTLFMALCACSAFVVTTAAPAPAHAKKKKKSGKEKALASECDDDDGAACGQLAGLLLDTEAVTEKEARRAVALL